MRGKQTSPSLQARYKSLHPTKTHFTHLTIYQEMKLGRYRHQLNAYICLPLRHEVGERVGVRWCFRAQGAKLRFFGDIFWQSLQII